MNAIGFVCRPWTDLVKKDDFIFPFLDLDTQIGHLLWQQFLQSHQLMIVSGKEGSATDPLSQIFCDRPGDGNTVVSARPSSHLIQNYQGSFGGIVENPGRFDHLHHESGLSVNQIVRRSDTGEDAIRQSEHRLFCRNKSTHLAENTDQGSLPNVGRFTRHVRTSDHRQGCAGSAGDIIGSEITACRTCPHHRVKSLLNFEDRLLDNLGSTPFLFRCNFGQRLKDVNFCNDR